jgi:LAO/AO transport system kinase
VLRTVATDATGFAEVVAELERHRAWLDETGGLARRRTRRARDEIEAIAIAGLRSRWAGAGDREDLDRLAAAVAAGEYDAYAAADRLLGGA